ncbi:unnamed protein product [Caenorhabditis bovis]|uniref:CTLH domain-containing protein n=1 Tax=Caenorhabditis bovis TaxID=2654633 RepID=A0A8S1EJ54_9PELO|nr:unnamed protein product [Caenorhabditis bovis]
MVKFGQKVFEKKSKTGNTRQVDDDEDDEDEAQLSDDGVIDQVAEGDIRNSAMGLNEYDQSTIRIVAQFLNTLGLKESVDKIVEETGCTVENSNAAKLRSFINNGKYKSAIATIEKCCPKYIPREDADQAIFYLQCFELGSFLRRKQLVEAVHFLREMTGEDEDKVRNNVLTAYVKELISSKGKEYDFTEEELRSGQLEAIQSLLPTSFMLPANRLKSLLTSVQGKPDLNNPFEVRKLAPKLLRDECRHSEVGKKKPKCVQVCTDHDSDVWIAKFSGDGKMLASGSAANNIILWNVENGKLAKCAKLDSSGDGSIALIEWSADNEFIAVCGNAQHSKYHLTIYNVYARSVYRILRVNPEDMSPTTQIFYTCCAFFSVPNKRLLIAATEHGTMKVYNLNLPEETSVVKSITGFRVRCVYGFSDGRRILASDSHNRLVLTTTSLNLRLWDLKTRTLIRYFSGACQQNSVCRFVIHATFGGVHNGFIATGTIGDGTIENDDASTEGHICIWDIDDCRPKLRLRGHTAPINAVTWNPKDPTMLVSCSDDSTIRVWRISREFTSKESSVLPRKIPRSMAKAKQRSISIEKNDDIPINGNVKAIIEEEKEEKKDDAFFHDYDFERRMIEEASCT